MNAKRNSSALPAARDLISEGALLLDLDGTLLDIAPRPDAVHVPPSMLSDLALLSRRMEGALGIITGRRLDDVDALLAPLRLPMAAEHGGVLRPFPDRAAHALPRPTVPHGWMGTASVFVDQHRGLLLEAKSAGFVIHYRLAPDHAGAALNLMRGLVAGNPEFEILRASMAWELRPRGVHKGFGLRALMALPPFAGRTPWFIGDDVTDEDAIDAAEALGGRGFRMAEHFGAPATLRAWLGALHGA